MGIRGFTSFVDSKNTQLLHDHKLHDTKVVIDGNNFYHFLYYYLHVKHHYGGDYDIYYKKVRDIFQMFLNCNITPYVVFDGGYEVDEKKLKTILTRAKNRIYLAGHLSRGGRGQILPILAEETFRDVLDDLGVSYVVCDFEADAEIVKLANQWHCPVMSNDSDFFIFDLKGGFILFDYADFSVSTHFETDSGKPCYFLQVEMYRVDNFVKVFPGFDKKLLPIIAILLGNDFIESAVFENFFSSLRYIGSKSLPQKHRQLVSIIHWLEECRTCEDAVERISTHLPSNSRERLINLIHDCINFYTVFDESFSLRDFFDGDRETALTQHTGSIKMYNGSVPPSWFISGHRLGTLHPCILNTAILHRVVLLAQVEDMKVTSAFATSVSIRQVTYGILLKDDLSPQKDSSGASQETHVLEYTRDECKNLKKSLIEPVHSITNYGPLPGLSDVTDVTWIKRVEIVLEVLSVPRSLIDQFSPSLQLLACVIVYWITHSEPKVMKHHYLALLVSNILLQAKARIRHIKRKKDSANDSEYECLKTQTTHLEKGNSDNSKDIESSCSSQVICVTSACEEATEGQLTSALHKLDKHHGKFMPITKTNPVESSITHGSSQFQSCLYDCLHLNQLLQSPLVNTKPHDFFSGVFLYNFTKELRSRSNPIAYIIDVLGAKSPLRTVFSRMDEAISECIGENAFQEMAGGKKNSKKKGKKKAAKKSSGCSSSDTDSSDDLPEMMQAACALDNRFSCLLLQDM